MKKRMLADVLWEAANTHLTPDNESRPQIGCFRESCCAALQAVQPDWWTYDFWDYQDEPAMKFLRDIGCDPDTGVFHDDYPAGEMRQGARYMWLLLAAKVAEDEGITA